MRTAEAPVVADRMADWRSVCRERTAPWLLSLYLAVAPASWLPGIPGGLLRAFEWFAVVSAVGLVLLTEVTARRLPFPPGLLGPAGFALLLALWIPGLSRAASIDDVVDFAVDFGSNCAFLWCFYCLARNGDAVWRVFRRAFVIFALVSGGALAHEVWDLDLWSTLHRWRNEAFSGFDAVNTGWSVALAMFLPISALLFCMPPKRWPLGWKRFSVLAAVMLVLGQFISGGRGGLFTGLAVVGGFALLPITRRFGLVLIVWIAIGAWTTCLDRSCADLLSLDEVLEGQVLQHGDGLSRSTPAEDSVAALCSLDRLATGRVIGYEVAAEKFADKPLIGHGLGQISYLSRPSTESEVHNLWLKWSVDTGVLAPLLFLAMAGAMLRAGRTVYRDQRRAELERTGAGILSLVLVAGLLVSLIEPWVPFGNFQIAGLWWAAGGVLLGLAEVDPAADGRLSSSTADPGQ